MGEKSSTQVRFLRLDQAAVNAGRDTMLVVPLYFLKVAHLADEWSFADRWTNVARTAPRSRVLLKDARGPRPSTRALRDKQTDSRHGWDCG